MENEKKFRVGECYVGQVQFTVNGENIFRYVICNAEKIRYRRFLGVTGYNGDYHGGLFFSADEYEVNENTTYVNVDDGPSLCCFPEYDEALGTCFTNIFDKNEKCLLGSNGKYMDECTELDYSPFRPLIYRITGSPCQYNLSSNLKFREIIPISQVLAVAKRMDIFTKESFTAKDVSDLLISITESPEKFGFMQEKHATNGKNVKKKC